jgi:hypothetical protein
MTTQPHTFRVHRTRFYGLGFVNFGSGHWQFIDLHGRKPEDWPSQVGPLYRTKAELLADLTAYARDAWGLA